MNEYDYQKRINMLETENTLLQQKLQRSEAERLRLEEIRVQHITMLHNQNLALQKSQQASQESEEKYRSVAENANDGIAIFQDMKLVYSNLQFAALCGREIDEMIGMSLETLVPAVVGAELIQISRQVQSGKTANVRYETTFSNKDDQSVFTEVSAASIHYQGLPAKLMVVHDITSRKQAEEHNRFLAFHDALTNLPNRLFFHERLMKSMSRAVVSGRFAVLMYMDLDQFKPINDHMGHAAGDMVLKEAAERLIHSVRPTDLVARIGGDEFAVIMDDVVGLEEIEAVAVRLLKAFEQQFYVNDRSCGLTASIGVSLYPLDGTDKDTLLHKADTAMYHSKQSGRNTYSFYCQLHCVEA